MTRREALVPPYIERLEPYSPGKPLAELERELGIHDGVKLASNENPLGPSPKAVAAVIAAASEVHRYPDANAYDFRHDLATHHGVAMDEICLGNGSNELIDIACRTFASPQDHGVFGAPSFVCYALGLTAANVPFTAVPLRNGLAWDVDDLLDAVRPETKLMFVAQPNNPTGAHFPRGELERLIRSVPDHVLLVVDEAYGEYADAEDFATAMDMRTLRARLLVLRTFSKIYGLAALRVGYGWAPRIIVDYLNRVRAPFNVNALAQVAARAALADRAHVQASADLNRRERARTMHALRDRGFEVAPSQANFVLVNVTKPSKEVYEALLRKGVIVRPMGPPIETWLRVSIGLPAENDRMLDALSR